MKFIQININEDICQITINRPNQLNALNNDVLDELKVAFEENLKNGKIAGFILTGAGNKAFVAGADIKEMSMMTPDESEVYSKKGQDLTLLIERYPKPVMAAVNGYALGGGCELAMSCHFRYSSTNALFGQPEVSLGLLAGFGGTQRLPRLIGKGRAMELLLSGKMISAEEALLYGLVNKVTSAEELLQDSHKILKKIVRMAPLALEKTIESINSGFDLPLEEGLKNERYLFRSLFTTSDAREGMNAFIQKRRAMFNGK
ncbi:MAG: enoyl-CoA hydratase/isomerase family protein [Fidelibacterota bacterium]